MKLILAISFMLVAFTACAEVLPYGNFENFSNWYRSENIDAKLNEIEENRYPIVIQAGPLLGDGVAYRFLCVTKPSKNFEYRLLYGKAKAEFEARDMKLKEAGFTLIHHQTVQLMGGVAHQAIWTK